MSFDLLGRENYTFIHNPSIRPLPIARVVSSSGSLTFQSGGSFIIGTRDTGVIDLNAGTNGITLDTAGSIVLRTTRSNADAINIQSTAADGDVLVSYGNNVDMVVGSTTRVSIGDTLTLNPRTFINLQDGSSTIVVQSGSQGSPGVVNVTATAGIIQTVNLNLSSGNSFQFFVTTNFGGSLAGISGTLLRMYAASCLNLANPDRAVLPLNVSYDGGNTRWVFTLNHISGSALSSQPAYIYYWVSF